MKTFNLLLKAVVSGLLAIGGWQGLCITVPALTNFSWSPGLLFMFAFFFSFYVMNFVAIYFLWRRPFFGFAMACVLFCLQVPQIETPTLTYRLASASGYWVQTTPDGLKVDTNWASCYSFERRTGWGKDFGVGPKVYGVNVFATGLAMLTFGALYGNKTPIRGASRVPESVSA